MSTRKPLGIAGFFDILTSAVAVSAAVRAHRKPRADDLVRLGVDPKAFDKIGNY